MRSECRGPVRGRHLTAVRQAQAVLQVPDATLPCWLLAGITGTGEQQDRQIDKVSWCIGRR